MVYHQYHLLLENLEIAKYFDFIGGATMDEVTRSTKEQVIEYTLASIGVQDRTKIVMIGDRHFDINGAKEFGLDSVGVLFGYGSKKELEQAGATYLVKAPKEIEKIIK